MSNEDRARAENHSGKAARPANDMRSSQAERDAAAKAVIDNMARLKALRLAREAIEPVRTTAAVKKSRGKSPNRAQEKAPALSDWLAGQQSGGRRT
jgi:hypothetical protein